MRGDGWVIERLTSSGVLADDNFPGSVPAADTDIPRDQSHAYTVTSRADLHSTQLRTKAISFTSMQRTQRARPALHVGFGLLLAVGNSPHGRTAGDLEGGTAAFAVEHLTAW